MQPHDDKTQTHVPLISGTMVSNYRIIEKIGAGGMGEVYLAEDTKLNRKVALKFLPPHLCQDPECRARFTREAQAAAKLSHPNIVTIYEVSEFNGRPFFAMELVDGLRLDEYLKQKSPSLDRILDLSVQACEGLREAHSSGIVHRDIKPGNILVDKNSRVRILDFGLAAIKGVDKLTKTGSTFGTLHYMSPEQTRGETLDERSDIFSFGVVLYEMITGQLPFKGDHEPAIIYSIGYEEPEPLARFKTGDTEELQRIVKKALTKNKSERYQHVDDLLADLKRESKKLEYVGASISAKSAATARPSIGVLYLQNLSENKEDEYFAAGITEDIITQLSKIGGLLVTSRSNVEQFRGKAVNIREAADKLRVNHIMEGSVRKHGPKIRITCQLIKAVDGFHVWADSYDRQIEDIFDIQADVAKSVAQALKVILIPEESERIDQKPTENVQAYNYYLQGREYYLSGFSTREGLYLATKMLDKALEADPNFALAYALLSNCYASYVMFEVDLKRIWFEKSEEASLKALALDPHLHLAYSSLSRLYWAMGKTERMLKKAEEAVIATPNNGESWKFLGFWYSLIGQYPKAERALMKAIELNPVIPSLYGNFIILYSRWGKDEKVAEYFRKGLEILPDNWWTYFRMAHYHLCRGELDEAKRMALKTLDINPRGTLPYLLLIEAAILSRDAESAFHFLKESLQQNPNRDLFIESGYIELMKGEKKQAEISFDSCIQFNLPLVREFEGLRDEYYCRSRIALAYALKDESGKALEQAEIVKRKLGEALLSVEWTFDRDVIQLLSFVYSLTEQKEDAASLLDFLVENKIVTSAYIRLHPFYEKLAGYPQFEELFRRAAQ